MFRFERLVIYKMTVKELINKLAKIKDSEKQVKFFHQERGADWLRLPVDEIADNDDHVLVGDLLPAEVYEKDYKYER